MNETEVDIGEKLRLERAAQEIDSTSGFQPKSFVSSASHKRLLKESTKQKNGGNDVDDDARGDTFQFGTSVDKKNSAFLAKINEEGLCHVNLFADLERREQKYLKNLFELRKKLWHRS